MDRLGKLYHLLFSFYGPQGWWPVISKAGRPGYDERGYHPGKYECFKEDFLEISLGAILTQNTNWMNAERALRNLIREGLLSRASLRRTPVSRIAQLIRPSGYYNQKAQRIKLFAAEVDPERFWDTDTYEAREYLLGLRGIGKETADSILLYAMGRPVFVVDAYTRRIVSRVEGEEWTDYEDIRGEFERSLGTAERFNEMHALLVEHAKRFCRKRPLCEGCPLREVCTTQGPLQGAL